MEFKEARQLDVEEVRRDAVDGDAYTLIDVGNEQSFAAEHLPGAKQACVYETAFLDKMQEAVSDKDEPLVVYGSSSDSYASRVAADKLIRAGYTAVAEFRGGLSAWREAGHELEEDADAQAELEKQVRPTARLEIDAEASRVYWAGRNLGTQHEGTLGVRDGFIRVVDGVLEHGEVGFDMAEIRCSDIPEEKMRGMLEAHLRSDDFFDVERYPTAGVSTLTVEFMEAAAVGSPNYKIEAELRLKDVSAPVQFYLTGGFKDDRTWMAQGDVQFDRTRWNVIYGSGKFFERLGMHVVNDMIVLQLKLVFRLPGG